jgi:hypothetical protein
VLKKVLDLLPFPIPSLSKVLGGALVGALIFSGVQTVRLSLANSALGSAKEVILRLTDWQAGMVHTVQLASGSPRVTADTAQAQVQAMGNSLQTLHGALKESNDAVDRLAEETRRAREVAAREAKARAAAIRTAEQLRDQLRERAVAPVPVDQMEAEVRRAQDATYEAGL